MKYDNGKAPLALIPTEVMNQIADVLGFGAEKYGANNWRDDGHTTEWSRTYSSIQRHLTSFWDGEDLDPESGKTHLAHAACQLVILMQHINDGHTAMDDRWVNPINYSSDKPRNFTTDKLDAHGRPKW